MGLWLVSNQELVGVLWFWLGGSGWVLVFEAEMRGVRTLDLPIQNLEKKKSRRQWQTRVYKPLWSHDYILLYPYIHAVVFYYRHRTVTLQTILSYKPLHYPLHHIPPRCGFGFESNPIQSLSFFISLRSIHSWLRYCLWVSSDQSHSYHHHQINTVKWEILQLSRPNEWPWPKDRQARHDGDRRSSSRPSRQVCPQISKITPQTQTFSKTKLKPAINGPR